MHAVGGVAGLCLNVKDTGARSWILRAMVGQKRRHIGLGAFPDVTLAQARDKAREARETILQGRDPVIERQRARESLIDDQARHLTFEDAARRFLRRKKLEFKNPKHAAQWESTLAQYAFPILGRLAVDEIELAHIVKTLEPIWTEKTETASRLRGRIESVLAWATVSGFRSGDNPARWRGNLDAVLPKPAKLKRVQHHAAVEIDDMPELMSQIRDRRGTATRCLEFVILTACRSIEARGADWSEIDLEAKTWTIPPDRIKAGREHVVPLCDRAIELLGEPGEGLIFPAPRGGLLSPEGLTAVLRRLKRSETVHGFRSTFRDWASERTNAAHEVAEQALAHAIPNATERAYRRGQLLEKRRVLMGEWAAFLNNLRG
jgi:integrase